MIFEKTTDQPEVNDKIYTHNTAPGTHLPQYVIELSTIREKDV